MSLDSETEIGQYKILKKIGEGGMGEVYLAEDSKLHRKVALKLLPEALSQSEERMRRFVQEARAASALNHPNIITIHDIGEAGRVNYIATEFIEGKTLDEVLASDDIEDHELLNVAIQIASALVAAHRSGIIHRDLKPENVMIRSDGIVKVLDFGLAKLTGEGTGGQSIDKEAATRVQLQTEPGKVMGTAAYMSPEQARGVEVDVRTDIWSFGVLLYEMIAGRRPFYGETASDLIAAILTYDPPPAGDSAETVPPALEHVIGKCLRKDKEERYQHIDDLLVDLRDIDKELEFGSRTGAGVTLKRRKRTAGRQGDITLLNQPTTARHSGVVTETKLVRGFDKWQTLMIGLSVLVTAGVLFTFYYFFAATDQPDPAFQRMRITKITSKGNVASAVIGVSPDGRYVAFSVQEDGKQSLWLRQVATTSDVQIREPGEVEYGGVSFSSDGDYIYYVSRNSQQPGSLYKIPTLGGEPEKIIDNVDGSIAFEKGGARVAFVRSETSLMVASTDGSGVEELAKAPEGVRWTSLSWRPDGSAIASSAFSSKDSKDHLYEIDVAAGTISKINSPEWLRISGIGWLPGGGALVLSGRDLETRLSQIWQVSYPDGNATRITNDLSNYFGVSIATSGANIASIKDDLVSNIWISGPGNGDKAVQLTFEEGRDEGMSGVAASPDGRIVYTVRIAGRASIWIVDPEGRNEKPLTKGPASSFSPAVSPDGRYIVFASDRNGNTDLWRMRIDGEDPVPLAASEGIEGSPDFSPDGNWVVYQVTDEQNETTLWKVSITGGGPVQLTDFESGRPRISPDGRYVLCEVGSSDAGGSPRLALVPFSGGAPERFFQLPDVIASREYRLSRDARAVIFVDSTGKVDNLFAQPLDLSPPYALTDFASERIFRFDVSADGTKVMARGHESSDVVMIQGLE